LGLLIASPLGDERDRLAVRRPFWSRTLTGGAGELSLRLAVSGQQPEVRMALVLVDVVSGNLNNAPFAIRSDRRRANASDLPQVGRRDRSLDRAVGECR